MEDQFKQDEKRTKKLEEDAANYTPTAEDISETNEEGALKLKKAEFPWEEALDTYDPEFPNYTPSEDAFNFFNVARLVAGQDFEVGNSLAQYFMIDVLFDNVTKGMFPYSTKVNDSIEIDNDRVGICCSRGLSKSTLITNFMFIYIAIMGKLPKHGRQKFWLALGASSKGHARNMALSLRAVCETSKYMNDTMEHMRFTETEAEFLRKGTGSEESRYFCIRFMGIFTPTRGQKNKFNARPDIAVLDDCLPSHSAAYSKTIMATLETAIHSDLGNALKASGGKIWNIFTPFNYQEPNTSSILNGSFTPVLLPVAKAFHDEENLNKADIVSSWPQMHTQKSIHKMWTLAKKSKTLKLFMQERMLRLSSGTDRLIPDSCIQWMDMVGISDHIEHYGIYITTDYTTTSGEKSDFSGVATWAVSSNEDWFLLNVTLRKRDMEQQYDETLKEAATWKRKGKHVEIGVELDGGQATHVYALEKKMLERGEWFSFAKQKGIKTDRKGILSRLGTKGGKHERFRVAIQQTLLQNKMWFPEHLKGSKDMDEFIQQLKGATHENFTRADDGPDLISMLDAMVINVPATAVPIKKSRDPSAFWDNAHIRQEEEFVSPYANY